ncbi:hypothetical protein [Chitinophaga agri]|uniref:Uncharacterized protein n=1 Tax=Chitinophaga agri TaxID=2703787 RepID=A0A6B9ZMZ5_9BACT|nr:hypothetical protein [Chitinophaga agri]QHS63239.1 hypothetical protein GWR21_27740 [Chitinophaga agri]
MENISDLSAFVPGTVEQSQFPDRIKRNTKMILQDLISLIGVKSTDPRIAQLFEQNNLGKPPKTITSNQGQKAFKDKQQLIDYTFKFDITNDSYYPPVSVRNEDYKFDNYLSNMVVFSKPARGKKEFVDPKPISFWDGFINPGSSLEECLAYFDNQSRSTRSSTIFEKSLNDIAEIKVWFANDEKEVTTIEIRIIEDTEIFAHSYFNPANKFNTVPQAYSLLVKWLFDNKYLNLSEETYSQELSLDHTDILAFVKTHLKSHIWDTQIKDIPYLRSFLFEIASNSSIKNKDGEEINFYIKNLYVRTAGKWEEHQKIYDTDILGLEDFENTIFLDATKSIQFLDTLTEHFALFAQLTEINK